MANLIKRLKNERFFVIAVLLIALMMRLIIINQSLWLDEAIGALMVKNYTYQEILSDFLRNDNHPPLYYLDLKSWTSITGYSEVGLRLPSVFYGLLTVFLTFLIAKKISFRNDQLFLKLSFFLIATSPFHIYYSQEARMYSLAAFLATLAIYSFLFVLEEVKESRNWWVIFSFSITALVFTDYPPVFLLPVFWLVGLIKKKDKKWWKNLIFSHLPLIFLGMIWWPTFYIQTVNGKWLMNTLPAWKQVAGGASVKQAVLVWMKFVLGRITFPNKVFYYPLVGLASIPFVLAIKKSLFSKERNILIWLWLGLPLTLGFLASFWAPIFIYFRFLYVIPAFYLIVAKGTSLIKLNYLRNFVLILLIVVNLTGWFFYIFIPSQQREQWRQATFFVEKRLKENELVIFEYPEPFSPYLWYSQKSRQAVGATDSISADFQKTSKRSSELVSHREGIYYFEYLRGLSDPDRVVEQVLIKEGFAVTEVFNYFPGVGQIFYWTKNEN